MNTTLVTSVTVRAPKQVWHRNDVPVRVEGTVRNMTVVEFTTNDLAVDLRLTNGERIALIEALGGRDGDSR